jgi:hypothetical protein
MEDEVIRKKIGVDTSRSHIQGLLPFFASDSDNNSIQYVDITSSDGNFGQYVCDFAVKTYEYGKGTKEIDRLRYCDLISRYHFVEKQLNNGAKLKRVEKIDTTEVCSSQTKTKIYTWVEDFNKKDCDGEWMDDRSKYDFTPVDANLFIGSNGIYTLSDSSTTNTYKDDKYEYIVLFDEYDEAMSYLEDWVSPKESGARRWRDLLQYKDKYDSLSTAYTMCQDIELHMLGKIFVPEEFTASDDSKKYKIRGSRVPQYIFYSDVVTMRSWFNTIEGKSTVSDGKRVWKDKRDERKYLEKGGEEFHKFLNDVKVSKIDGNTYKEDASGGDYLFLVPPYIPIPILFTDNQTSEGVKVAYETDDDAYEIDKFSAYTEYSAVTTLSSNYISNFAEIFGSASVETQLASIVSPKAFTLTDGLFGIWDDFKVSSGTGAASDSKENYQFFKCTYRTGWSQTGVVEVYTSGWTYGTKEDGSLDKDVKRSKDRKDIGTISEILPYITNSKTYQVIGVNKLGHSNNLGVIGSENYETNESGETIIYSAETQYDYEWWECVREYINPQCADGEAIKPNDSSKYKTVTILESVPQVANANPKNGDFYYFLSKQDNGYTWENGAGPNHQINDLSGSEKKVFRLPYVLGKIVNEDAEDESNSYGNALLSRKVSGNNITLKYVVGGHFNSNVYDEKSGIVYEETQNYVSGTTKIDLDEASAVTVFYETLSANTEGVKSEDYLLTRNAQRANIVSMEIGSVWTSATAICTKLISQDDLDGLQNDPSVDFSLEIDRGTAAAWESHFKLTECNTLEDLENYGNNYFNL